jgi:hypothetical protein
MHRYASYAVCAVVVALLSPALPATAHSSNAARTGATANHVPAMLAVNRPLAAPPSGVSELKFQDVFKLPIGPKALEPTEKLRGLDGRRVRIVGYMVQQESPAVDAFLLSPLPVMLGDEDESLADDLPPSTIRVELPTTRGAVIPNLPGLLQLTGVLHVGMRADAASGRATPAQLVLDAKPARALARLARSVSSAPRKSR